MALPLLPILLLGGAAVAALVAGGGGGGTQEGAVKLWKPLNLEAAKQKWTADQAVWQAKVDELAGELDSPDDIAVLTAKTIFPDYPWPAYGYSMPESYYAMWKWMKMDVWGYLEIEEHPFPPG